jgi:sulfate permease, SulP family
VTGVVFYGLGAFRLGSLIRFIPYPVIGGFLAGTGWLLARGGMEVMADSASLAALVGTDMAIRWLPGAALAVALLLLLRRFSAPFILPGALRELRAAGAANVAVGLGGGLVGFHALTLSVLADKLGAASRATGVVMAAVCAAALVGGMPLFAFVPIAVVGGFLLFVGLGLLVDWVIDARTKMSRADYLLVLLILGVIVGVGFMEGVVVGVIVAATVFIVNYSRIGVVKQALSGETYRSNVDRPTDQEHLLTEHGDQIAILRLHGFLFFGTAYRLLRHITERVEDPSRAPLRFLVLDFGLVTGLDSSAVMGFVKLRRLAVSRRFTVLLTGVPPPIRDLLERGGWEEPDGPRGMFPDVDRALAWCEEQLLARLGAGGAGAEAPLQERLATALGENTDPDTVLSYLERQELPGGAHLLRQGQPTPGVFFIESGRVSAELGLEDGGTLRLRTMGAGTVVGEMGTYLGTPASASVLADGQTVAYLLTPEALARMADDDPRTAVSFHAFIVRLLAERLAHADRAIRALRD